VPDAREKYKIPMERIILYEAKNFVPWCEIKATNTCIDMIEDMKAAKIPKKCSSVKI
jgi:hypothetical protein